MFIIKFNNMVKNKWVWAAFALIVAIAFGASDILDASARRSGERGRSSVGTLAGEPVDPLRFEVVTRMARLDMRGRNDGVVEPREVWKTVAALAKADELGIRVSDRALATILRADPSFRGESGAFDERAYRELLRRNDLSPVLYQEIVRARLRLATLRQAVAGGAWAPPSVVEDRVRGLSDSYTLRFAVFSNAFSAAEAEISPEEAKSYYDSHQEQYSVPERRRVAYVVFPSIHWRGQIKPEEDDVFDWYDSHQSDFATTGTNGVEPVKTLVEARPEIEKTLARQLEREAAYRAACDLSDWFFESDSATEADFAVKAAEAGMTVTTSGLFAAGSAPVSPSVASDFSDEVFSLALDSLKDRVGNAVGGESAESFVPMLLEIDPAHVKTYGEVSNAVLSDAKSQKAASDFQKAVSDVQSRFSEGHATGESFEEMCRALGMTPGTNVAFSYLQADSRDTPVPSPRRVAQAMTQLGPGDICLDAIPVPGGVLFFEVVSREEDATGVLSVVRTRVREGLSEEVGEGVWEKWLEDNLKAMNPVPAVPFDDDSGEGDEFEPEED